MLRVFRHMRFTPWGLIVMMALAVGATCVSAAEQTRAQRACCEAMAHDCGEMALEASCCSLESRADYALVALQPVVAPAPLAVLTQISAAAESASTVRFASFDWSPLKPPGVPTYLFVASFRI